ncbi:class I SAM-dependent DNA methyltransferase [Desertimonas flava]|uniref:class I SAM-dependent DNA methyltransferase n=1 Tax=Desertimonas flava TaxID=2064846 RepID=UPI0019694309|nr:class I SAM-dependent methyltransferase [Desertimonas flava]
MSRAPSSGPQPTSDAYFAEMWGRADDPWDHGSRWYEKRKYGLTVAALPRPRYRRAFEPGCGAGFLTAALASRTDHLLAMERSPRGVSVTRRRCAAMPGVDVRRGRIPHDWPADTFDLIVLSEVLYYLDDDGLALSLRRAGESLEPDGHLIAVHYRPPVEEHARLGDDVHGALRAALGEPMATYQDAEFVLDVFSSPRPVGGSTPSSPSLSQPPADRPT